MANVAHDLRSPLNVLKGCNDIIKLKLGSKANSELEIYFKRFDDQIIYMSSIIEDIIDMAMFKSYKFTLQEELFDIHSLINDVIQLFEE